MSRPDCLAAFYAERAELAHTIEHTPRGQTAHNLTREKALQDDIEHLEALWAGKALVWCSICGSHARMLVPGTLLCGVCTELIAQGEITAPPPRLPWCSICGRDDRELLPGQTLCAVCAGNLETGAITPGEHAEASQGQE